eukprot:gene3971-4224_t
MEELPAALHVVNEEKIPGFEILQAVPGSEGKLLLLKAEDNTYTAVLHPLAPDASRTEIQLAAKCARLDVGFGEIINRLRIGRLTGAQRIVNSVAAGGICCLYELAAECSLPHYHKSRVADAGTDKEKLRAVNEEIHKICTDLLVALDELAVVPRHFDLQRVVMSKDGAWFFLDFSQGVVCDCYIDRNSSVICNGAPTGSTFMAPEQAAGQQESQLSTIYQASAEQAHLMSGGKITMQMLKDAQSKAQEVQVVEHLPEGQEVLAHVLQLGLTYEVSKRPRLEGILGHLVHQRNNPCKLAGALDMLFSMLPTNAAFQESLEVHLGPLMPSFKAAMGVHAIECMRVSKPHNLLNAFDTILAKSPFETAEDGLKGIRYLVLHVTDKIPYLIKHDREIKKMLEQPNVTQQAVIVRWLLESPERVPFVLAILKAALCCSNRNVRSQVLTQPAHRSNGQQTASLAAEKAGLRLTYKTLHTWIELRIKPKGADRPSSGNRSASQLGAPTDGKAKEDGGASSSAGGAEMTSTQKPHLDALDKAAVSSSLLLDIPCLLNKNALTLARFTVNHPGLVDMMFQHLGDPDQSPEYVADRLQGLMHNIMDATLGLEYVSAITPDGLLALACDSAVHVKFILKNLIMNYILRKDYPSALRINNQGHAEVQTCLALARALQLRQYWEALSLGRDSTDPVVHLYLSVMDGSSQAAESQVLQFASKKASSRMAFKMVGGQKRLAFKKKAASVNSAASTSIYWAEGIIVSGVSPTSTCRQQAGPAGK